MKIFVVDIENVPTRYTAQWKKWYPEFFNMEGYEFQWIGYDDVCIAKKDEFLSFIPSNRYKAKQTQELANLLDNGLINEGDMILFLDAWHPGIISVRQMLLSYDKNVKLAGFWHAGSWDPHDMLGRNTRYFIDFEAAVHNCLDYNLFATNFSSDLFIIQMSIYNHLVDIKKNHIVGFLYDIHHLSSNIHKKKQILFPHRIAPEKCPYMFDELERYCENTGRLQNFSFIKTMDATKNKAEYHTLLAESKYAVSFAKQETFGISMMEAAFSGCVPIVPNCLSYVELYLDDLRYDHMQISRDTIYEEIVSKIEAMEHSKYPIFSAQYKLMDYINGSKFSNFLSVIKA